MNSFVSQIKNVVFLTMICLSVFSLNNASAMVLDAPDGTQVEILRDEYGVPHITGSSETGVIFGQGFAITQDRFYQMEVFRRTGEGTLAEVLGAFVLPQDQEVRRISYTETERTAIFEALPLETQNMLTAYTSGVNACIDSMETNPQEYLPQEFLALPYGRWTVEKSIAVIVYMVRNFGVFGGEELTRLAEFQNNGDVWFDQNRPINDPAAPTTIVGDEEATDGEWTYCGIEVDPRNGSELTERIDLVKQIRRDLGIPNKFGSFSVLMPPSTPPSGNSMLLGCPQMGAPQQNTFNTVAEVELTCDEFHVAGMTIPGVPGIIIGRNENCAWTMTSGISDNSDIYIETLQNNDMSQYFYNDEWVDFETTEHEIDVAGQGTVDFTVYRSVHGPVVQEDLENNQAFTIKTASWFAELEFLSVFQRIWRAENAEQFAEALADNPVSFNFFYADENEVHYWHTGQYQNREDGIDPRLPHNGDGSEEWVGILPFEELPQASGETQEYFVNWNNKPVSWWNNGDNVPWIGGNHVTNIDNYVSANLETFDFNNLMGVPQAINSHGTWQQAIEFETDNASSICPPGQSNFVDVNGQRSPHYSDQWQLHTNWEFKTWHWGFETSVDDPTHELPLAFLLQDVYPNPFNSVLSVKLQLPTRGDVRISMFNLLGEEVSSWHYDGLATGSHRMALPLEEATSGMYFLQASSNGMQTGTKQVVLVK